MFCSFCSGIRRLGKRRAAGFLVNNDDFVGLQLVELHIIKTDRQHRVDVELLLNDLSLFR